ncbi:MULTISPECIES: DUF4145 domain-containing protein [unclassified Lysinibacillus]|uniref:DUF4145 domain-containing protein n=1 Tax=Lysinibacillus TaxID=400634 RepID=UPI0038296717
MNKIKVCCRKCKIETNHEVLFNTVVSWEEDEARYYENEYYRVCRCLGCETVCFVYEFENSQMWTFDENGNTVHFEHIEIFPEPKKKIEYERKKFSYVPDMLENLYVQVVDNYEMGHYILASVGIRMIIEGLCRQLGVMEGFVVDSTTNEIVRYAKGEKQGQVVLRQNLEGKINGLFTGGILTKNQTDILHSIRDIGNESAHELVAPSKSTLEKVLEVIEFTFTTIYELKKYEKL